MAGLIACFIKSDCLMTCSKLIISTFNILDFSWPSDQVSMEDSILLWWISCSIGRILSNT